MNDRELKFALVATTPNGETVTIARAATRAKLEKEREKARLWSDAPLTIVELTMAPREPKGVSEKLDAILGKMRALTAEQIAQGEAPELLSDALELVAGRHRPLVDAILAAYQETS